MNKRMLWSLYCLIGLFGLALYNLASWPDEVVKPPAFWEALVFGSSSWAFLMFVVIAIVGIGFLVAGAREDARRKKPEAHEE